MPPSTTKETLPHKKLKLIVEDMFTLREEGKTWEECYRLTHPESKAKPESMGVMAYNKIRRYHELFPDGYVQHGRRMRAKASRRLRRLEDRLRREQDADAAQLDPLAKALDEHVRKLTNGEARVVPNRVRDEPG